MRVVQKHGKPCAVLTLDEALPIFATAWQENPNLPLAEVYRKAAGAAFARAGAPEPAAAPPASVPPAAAAGAAPPESAPPPGKYRF
jgi:hypothetical protein